VKWIDGARIPTLAQVIEVARAAPRSFQLFVELKTSFLNQSLSATPVALAEASLQVLRKYAYMERTTLVSFDWRGLLHARRASTIECWFTTLPQKTSNGGLAGPDAPAPSTHAALRSSQWESASSRTHDHDMNYGGLTLGAIAAGGGQGWFADYRDLTAGTVAQAHALGLKVGAWTVNDPGEMRAVQGLGPDAICTDRPDLLLATMGAATLHGAVRRLRPKVSPLGKKSKDR